MSEGYLKKLEAFMVEERPHLDSTLTLPQLSGQLGISVHHLSQVINDKRKQNFFEFINCYRVEEAKLLLRDKNKQHLTITAIGFEAGFNSNSSFNDVFKKQTGQTPSQYRNTPV
jgi:AraC-like DNA-binding protein